MIPYSPQKIVNFDPIKIDPLLVMSFYGTPNLDKIFFAESYEFFRINLFKSYCFFPFHEIINSNEMYECHLLDLGLIGPITSNPHCVKG